MRTKKGTRTKIKSITGSKNRVLYSKIFLWCIALLAALVAILLIVEYVNFGFVSDIFANEYDVAVPDECSIIMGNLLHTIRDSTDCKLQCNNRCNIDGNKFINSEFAQIEADCNSCNCVCK